MHPDLDALRAHYDRLAADSRAGHITPEDAFMALSGLSVPDGGGAVWKINTNGEFTRAEYPGAPDVVTDAGAFLDPATTVANPETGQYGEAAMQPSSPTWDMTPPSPVGGPGSPSAGGFGTPPPQPGTGTAPTTPNAGGFGTPAPGQGTWASATATRGPTDGPPALSRGFDDHHGRSLADAEAASSREPLLARALVWANAHKMLLIIAALALVFLGFKLAGGGEQGTDLPTGNQEDVVATTPANDPQAESLPSPADVTTVTSALVSGDRALAKKLVAVEPTEAQSAHVSAFYAGLGKAGLTLNPGPLAAGGDASTALQQWEVKSADETVLLVPVIWVLQGDGTWKLESLPLPPTV